MSNETATPNATAKPKRTRAPKAKAVPFSSCHVRFASAKGIDVTRAAKLNRSYVRSNFEQLSTLWPELKASHKKNRDANRYPETIPAKVAELIVTRSVPSKKTAS